MPLTHQVFTLASADGTSLKGRFWKPKTDPLATIILVHGIGEHSGRYDLWARQFCRLGIMVYALDYRGHGLSAGKRGHINHLSEYLDDISALVKRCRRNHGDIPSFIYGHSMGGNLVLSFLLKRHQNFTGAIITSPWIGLVNAPTGILLKVGTLMNHIFPGLTMSTGIKSSSLSSIKKNQIESDIDTLMHGKITLRTFFEVDKSADGIMKNIQKIEIPVLLCHGDADNVTRFDFSQKLATLNQEHIHFKIYQGALHELHNEPIAEELQNDILSWIFKRIGRQS